MEDLKLLAQKYFLSVDGENSDNDGEIPYQWLTLDTIKNRNYWKTLIDNLFDEDRLLVTFQTLSEQERDDHFKFGIACFVAFVQSNFTGPLLEEDFHQFLEDMFEDRIFNKVLVNVEICANARHVHLLAASKRIFDGCVVNNIINQWWSIRLLVILQHILEDLSPVILSNAKNILRATEDLEMPDDIRAAIYIEITQLFLQCRQITKAQECISSAIKLLGVNYNLIGKLGKRTRYQEKDIAQLVLEVTIDDCERTQPDTKEANKDIPVDQPLNDEIRLNSVEFTDKKPNNIILRNVEQKLFLTIVHDMFVSKPKDELLAEEIQPFLDVILSQKNSYTVRVAALLFRCKLEGQNRRTIERCLLQTEEIISYFKKESPSCLQRVPDVFGSGLIPFWKVQSQYAELLLNIGLVKNSLEIFFQLEQWEDVIVCYTILQLRHKAAEVIKEQLQQNPTVKLWCLLGDATDDVSCYETAWEMSKKRSFRAQRHWGQFYFERKKYDECIPHFEKSVSINPLQPNIWFRLGFAALQLENWQTSATAFRRYTTLEPEGFEAWNNLAQAYIKLGNKRSAHQALLEALKCNFENWKVWENFMVVSCDIGNYSDVVRAYHKVIDLDSKYLNFEVLSVLVYGLLQEGVAADEKASNYQCCKRTRELMGRLTASHPREGYIWELYALIAPSQMLRLQRLHKAYIGYTQTKWDKDVVTCQKVLQVAKKLCETILDDQISAKDPNLHSVRMNVNSALVAAQKQDWEDTRELMEEVAELLIKVIEKIW